MAFDLMLEHWNPRCSPPWSADQIEHLKQKVENGYSYNTSPPGNITAAYKTAATLARFKPVVTQLSEGHQITAGRFRIVSRPGMREISPPSWLIEGFLPANSYTMLFGEPGTFKTFLALDIALSIAIGDGFGVDAPWQRIIQTGPVLFAAGEGRSDITRRIQAWEKRHNYGGEVDNFSLADPVPLVNEKYQPFIDAAKQNSPKGYKLVVLDTVGRAMAGLNENAQEHASAFSNLVENLQYSLGCAVLVLHHTGLQEKHRSRGSSVFGADADTIVRLDRQSKARVVSLTMTKQKDAQEWERKKYIRMETVIVSLDPMVDSLVAVTGQAIEDKEDADKFAAVANVDDVAEEVSDAIVEHLSLHQDTVFVDLSLAQAVAGAGGVKEDSIRRKYLKIIRVDKEKRASRLYDKDARQGKGAWQWIDD
jgi:KaiC/GvpD/RAD55 family RecA-like ATPase